MTSILEIISGALTPVIALIALGIAYQQYRTNRWRARESVFDRRLEVFTATATFIDEVLTETNPTLDQITEFRRATSGACFLFGQDVHAYLDELTEKGIRCRQVHRRLEQQAGGDSVDSETVELDSGLVGWFLEQTDESRFAVRQIHAS